MGEVFDAAFASRFIDFDDSDKVISCLTAMLKQAATERGATQEGLIDR
jgi:hypothetical protein